MEGKVFRLRGEQLQPVATGLGSCIASDRITVDGCRVGYMYREAPDNEIDSGWRFLAGTESEEYLGDPDHFELYDVNTIANYDESIIEWLESPPGSAFGRGEDGRLAPEPFEDPPEAQS